MLTQELIDFVKLEVSKGKSKEEISKELLSNNWSEADINMALNAVLPTAPASPMPGAIPVPAMPTLGQAPMQPVQVSFPGAFATFGQAWRIYKSRFWTLVGVMLFPIPINILFGILVQVISSYFGEGSAMGILWSGLFNLASSLILLWMLSSLLYAIKDHEERIGVIESYRRGLHKAPSLFWVSFLYLFIIWGGTMLLIIPGIILSIYLVFYQFILINENIGGMSAILKSREYTRGHWWGIFWRLLMLSGSFLILLSPIIFFALLFPGFSAMTLTTASAGMLVVFLLVSFVMLLAFLFPTFMQVYMFSMYQNLKAMKGDFIFEPKKARKTKYIIIAILGALLIPIMASVLLVSLKSAREKANLMKQEQVGSPLGSSESQTGSHWLEQDGTKIFPDTGEVQILYSDFSYSLQTPKGWKADFSEDSDVIFNKENESKGTGTKEDELSAIGVSYLENETLKDVIESDKKNFVEKIKGKVEDGKDILMNDGSIASVKYYSGGVNNLFYAAAYINAGKRFVMVYMDLATKERLNDSLPAFEELVKSFKLLQAETSNASTPVPASLGSTINTEGKIKSVIQDDISSLQMTPTSDSFKANLGEKPYVDKDLGFKIYLPKEPWKLKTFSKTNAEEIRVSSSIGYTAQEVYYGGEIKVKSSLLSDKINLDDFVSSSEVIGDKVLETTKIKLGGLEAVMISSTFGESNDEINGQTLQLFVIKNKHGYRVSGMIHPISTWDMNKDMIYASLLSFVPN